MEENYLKKELYELMKKDDLIFEFLQAGSLDGLWYWDLDNPENRWMSPRFWENFGYDPKTKEHKSVEWRSIIDPEHLKIVDENLKMHCADPNHPYDQIVKYKRGDGGYSWVRCRGIAIRDSEGVPHRMLGAHTDITKVKDNEEQLALMNQMMKDRELRMIELKQEVDTLLKELGREPKYYKNN